MTKPKRPANKLDMRPFYTRKIFELLAQRGKLTRGQISDELDLHKHSTFVYLHQMREDGIVRRNGYLHGAPLWELGEDTEPVRTKSPVLEMCERQVVIPARQIGMQRHWMDVALFGPARTEHPAI